tara:strand:- start:446 stop:637 length:192 start_codon:yes stop_codon:yes gene_type:complete
MSAFTFVEVHKSLVKSGDTIKHNDKEMTVCSSDITRCEFFGIKIFGDSYRLGTKKVIIGRLRK